jgi:hypothetical protein
MDWCSFLSDREVYQFYVTNLIMIHISWVPCHNGRVCPHVADGGDALQVSKETANILNKHSRTSEKL